LSGVRTHLVTGVAGQDGVLLARLLLAHGDRVVGTVLPDSGDALLGYLDRVEVVEHDVRDTDGFAGLVDEHRPDVVHNLAALTSVGASWDARADVVAVNATAVEDMLDVLRRLGPRAPRFVHASSSEVFGRAGGPGSPVDPQTPLAPLSPYAEAKVAAHRAVQRARDEGLPASNLVLFGHTSVLQAGHFVLPTVAEQAAEVGLGRREVVSLRDPTASRDWGSAHDFVRAFDLATSVDCGDFVIGTGAVHSLGEIAAWALAAGGAAGAEVTASGEDARPDDFGGLRADVSAAARGLGWAPGVALRNEIEHMVAVASRRISTGVHDDPAYLEDAPE
jgi:GDPmannose 4,6-dehydratase